jgi:hypothetical protein
LIAPIIIIIIINIVRGALKYFVTVNIFHSEGWLTPRPTLIWRTTPCRLSATVY